MSGAGAPRKSIKSGSYRRIRPGLFTSVHGVSVVILWSHDMLLAGNVLERPTTLRLWNRTKPTFLLNYQRQQNTPVPSVMPNSDVGVRQETQQIPVQRG